MVTTTFALAQKSYPSDENDSFHSTHCSAIFDNTPPAEPDFTNHISVSACNVSGQDTIDENSPDSINNDCSAFFDNTGLVNTPAERTRLHQSHFRVGMQRFGAR